MARRRPLQTCATSCLNIAHKARTKFQDLDGPVGSTTKRVITFFNFFSPFLHAIIHRCLTLLSIIDDQILTIQHRIEIVFPKSACIFDRVDEIVSKAECLPEQVEDVIRKFPSMMHQFPLLDRILFLLISWLNFLLSILTHWGSKSTGEKEITIDVNCNDCKMVSEEKTINPEASKSVHFEKLLENGNGVSSIEHSKIVPSEVVHLSVKRLHSWKNRIKALEEPLYAGDSPMYSSYHSANSSPVSDGTQDENIHCNQTGMSCSYKEMLEKGTKDDDQEEDMSYTYKEMLERGAKDDDREEDTVVECYKE